MIHMDRTIYEIISEARRVEEDVTFSGKRHFNASSRWDKRNYWIGIPSVIAGSIASATGFADLPYLAGFAGGIAAILAALATFLKPSRRAAKHLASGNAYFTLKNEVRIFRRLECEEGADVKKLKTAIIEFSNRRNLLNDQALNTSDSDYRKAKEGIENGEQSHEVDQSSERENQSAGQ